MSMWLRPQSNFNQNIQTKNESLFSFSSSLQCNFTFMNVLACTSFNSSLRNQTEAQGTTQRAIELPLTNLRSQTWIHLAISGNIAQNTTYIRLDYQDQLVKQVSGAYLALISQSSNFSMNIGSWLRGLDGYQGDIRELLIVSSFVPQSQIDNIRNQIIYWNLNQLGNYRMVQGSLQDLFRTNMSISFFNLTSSVQPTWSYDNQPNDMCYPFFNKILLPRLDNITANQVTIDSRMSNSISNWQYTGSFWLRLSPGHSFSEQYSASNALFILHEAFALWFTGPQRMKIFFFQTRVIFERPSLEFSFPMNQWFNLQFQLERTTGYSIRIYDLQRREVVRVDQSVFFEDQRPTRQMRLFNNMRGFMKSALLYQEKRSLPIDHAFGPQAYIRDNNLIVYYKFDSVNIVNNSLMSLGNNSNSVPGPSITLPISNSTIEFIEWEESLSYTNITRLGTLNQTSSLYDGIACQDDNLAMRLSSRQSRIQSQLGIIQGNLTEATVEFWFLQSQLTQDMSYLFSLYSNETGKEHLALYQQASKTGIFFDPIDSRNKSFSNTTLNIGRSLDDNLTGWQHVACKFKSQSIIGCIYHEDSNLELFSHLDLNGKPLLIPSGSYFMIIGNSFNQSLGSLGTIFKEVRLWKSFQEDRFIKRHLYRQLNPSIETNIISYFRLNSGLMSPENYPNLGSPTRTLSQDLILVKPSLPLAVCPINSYPNLRKAICTRNPYINQRLLIIPQLSFQSLLAWKITSEFSDMHFNSMITDQSFQWSSPNQTLFNISLINSNQIRLNKTLLSQTPAQQLRVNQRIQNLDRTFYQENSLDFRAYNCTFLVDNGSQQSLTFTNYDSIIGEKDIEYSLKQIKLDECEPNEKIRALIQERLDIQTYPSDFGIANITQQYFSENQTFKIILPKAEQTKLKKYDELRIIITVTWNITDLPEEKIIDPNNGDNNNNTTNDTSTNGTNRLLQSNITFVNYQASHNLVYRIRFVDKILTKITLHPEEPNMIDEDLILDANATIYPHLVGNGNEHSGISFFWTCPLKLQKQCEGQTTSERMILTYDDFLQSRAPVFNEPYLFTLSAWKSSEEDQLANYTIINANYWLNFPRPIFSYEIQDTTTFISSADNYIYLNFETYDFKDPNLRIFWTSEPQIQSAYISFEHYDTKVKIAKGALIQDKDYKIKVFAQNQTYLYANYTQIVAGKTYLPPIQGNLSIDQTNGSSLETIFKIRIGNWSAVTEKLLYKIYGVFQGKPSQRYLLQDTDLMLKNQSQIEINTRLPSFNQIIVLAIDENRERTEISANLTITVSDTNDLLTLTQNLIPSTGGLNSSQLADLKLISWEIQSGLHTTQLCTNVTAYIISYLLQATQNYTVANDILNNSTIQINYAIMELLDILLSQKAYLDDEIVDQSITVFKQNKLLRKAIQQNMKDQQFKQLYTNVMSHQIGYTIVSFDSVLLRNRGNSRNLQSNNSQLNIKRNATNKMLNHLLSELDDFITFYCDQMTILKRIFYVKTDQFYINFELHPNKSLIVNRTYYSDDVKSTIVLPIDRILTKHRELLKNEFDKYCQITTFFNFNPYIAYIFVEQDIFTEASPIIEIKSYDTKSGMKVLEQDGVWLTNQSIQTAVFNYDFNRTSTFANFSNNQTVCLKISKYSLIDQNRTWSYQDCQTTYNVAQKSITCRCKNIGSFYMAIGNDYSRMPILVKDDKDRFNQLLSSIKRFDTSIVPILIFISLMVLIFPCASIILDSKDFDALKHDSYEVTDDMIRKVAIKKKEPFELVIYNKKRYSRFSRVKNPGFCTFFRIFMIELHPIFSLFGRFDIELKRLLRFIIVGYQICLIAIISAFAFGYTYRQDDQDNQDRVELMDQADKNNSIAAGIVLGVLTLPFSQKIMNCFRSRLISEINSQPENEKSERELKRQRAQKKKQTEKKSSPQDVVSQDFDGVQDIEDNRIQHTQTRLKNGDKSYVYREDNTMTNLETTKIEEPVIIVDKCIPCKLLVIIFSFVLAILTLLLLSLMSGESPKPNSQCMSVAFFTALLIGYCVYNTILIFMTAILAPRIVQEELEYGELSFCYKIFDCLVVSSMAKTIMRDIIIVNEVADHQNFDLQPKNEKKAAGGKNQSKNGPRSSSSTITASKSVASSQVKPPVVQEKNKKT